MTVLPLFFPTRVVLIDDEPRILRTTSLLLERLAAVAQVLCFERAQDALDHFERVRPGTAGRDPFPSVRARDEYRDGPGHEAPRILRALDLSPPSLRAALDAALRDPVDSLVVCDYAMPQMDGIAFFERLADPHVRRVLLTALCDERFAVRAFNRNQIHQFVHKADPSGPAGLVALLAEQLRAFFRARTAAARAALAAGAGGEFLRHPGVGTLLDVVTREYGVRGFVFQPDPPGFIVHCGPGDYRFLALGDEASLDRCARVVEEIDGPAALARALRARDVMPVGRDGRPIYEAHADWRAAALAPNRQGAGGDAILFWVVIPLAHGCGEVR